MFDVFLSNIHQFLVNVNAHHTLRLIVPGYRKCHVADITANIQHITALEPLPFEVLQANIWCLVGVAVAIVLVVIAKLEQLTLGVITTGWLKVLLGKMRLLCMVSRMAGMSFALSTRLWDHRAHYFIVRLVPLFLERWPLHVAVAATWLCSCWGHWLASNTLPAALNDAWGANKVCVNGERLESHRNWSTGRATNSPHWEFLHPYCLSSFPLMASSTFCWFRQPSLSLPPSSSPQLPLECISVRVFIVRGSIKV